MPKTKKPNLQTNKQALKKHWKIISIISVIFVSFILYDIFFGGNIVFYSQWISCSSKPLKAEGPGLFGVGTRAYHEAPTISLLRGENSQYFCTPYDAEMAGVSASQYGYEFPHLTPEENRQVRNRIIFGN